MTIQEIETVVNRKEKETIKIELKSFEKLFSKDKGDDIACGIVAFANCFGGKIIFGITNEGDFEGKFTGNIDKVKENFYNLTKDKISPSITLQVNLIENANWDVIVIEVPKKTRMPFAFVQDRKSHEIKNRLYYKRTGHGKKLVTDAELDLLFQYTDEPESNYEYRLSAEFNKQYSLVNIDSFATFGNYTINNFLDRIDFKRKEEIFKNNDQFCKMMLELYPYLYLKLFMTYYRHSWYIHITDGFDRSASGSITNEDYETQPFSITETPTEGFSLLKDLVSDFNGYIKAFGIAGFDTFQLPKNSQIKLFCDDKYSSIIIINELFDAEIIFSPLSYGVGVHQRNPLFEENSGFDAYDYFQANFYHFDGACSLVFKINTDKTSFEEYKRLQHYFTTLNKLIKKHWDVNEIIKRLPPKETRVMAKNVAETLNILKAIQQSNTTA